MAEAKQNVPVGHLGNSVGEGPDLAVVLNAREPVLARIEIPPRTPLPDDLSIDRHLDKVIANHLTVVVFGAGAAAADFWGNILRKRSLADEENITVLQSDAVVSVLGIMHLPQNVSPPIH